MTRLPVLQTSRPFYQTLSETYLCRAVSLLERRPSPWPLIAHWARFGCSVYKWDMYADRRSLSPRPPPSTQCTLPLPFWNSSDLWVRKSFTPPETWACFSKFTSPKTWTCPVFTFTEKMWTLGCVLLGFGGWDLYLPPAVSCQSSQTSHPCRPSWWLVPQTCRPYLWTARPLCKGQCLWEVS